MLMLLSPSLPMDSTAISTALWTFAGYFPFFLLGDLTPFIEQESANLITLIVQGGAIGALVVYGILRDIRRESRAE